MDHRRHDKKPIIFLRRQNGQECIRTSQSTTNIPVQYHEVRRWPNCDHSGQKELFGPMKQWTSYLSTGFRVHSIIQRFRIIRNRTSRQNENKIHILLRKSQSYQQQHGDNIACTQQSQLSDFPFCSTIHSNLTYAGANIFANLKEWCELFVVSCHCMN